MECTLGVQWNMETDDFKFRVIDEGKNLTRRGILSVVSSMYDPLGFVTPIISPAKSLLQSLCKQNYSCNEEISEVDLALWNGWLNDLSGLRTISLPRCFKPPGLVWSRVSSYTIFVTPPSLVTEWLRIFELSMIKMQFTAHLSLENHV